MPNLRQKQQALIDDFTAIENPMERLQALVDQAKSDPDLPAAMKTDRHRVEGCLSRVWLCGRLDESGRCDFRASAESAMVQGLVRLLCRVYSGHSPGEVVSEPLRLWEGLRLERHLSPTRRQGLELVRQHIVRLARSLEETEASEANAASSPNRPSLASH